jgi:hypothetical protein
MKVEWSSRRLWMTVGYVASAAWMLLVLAMTNGNVRDPFFNMIFIVPLAGWVIGLVIARVVVAVRNRRDRA